MVGLIVYAIEVAHDIVCTNEMTHEDEDFNHGIRKLGL